MAGEDEDDHNEDHNEEDVAARGGRAGVGCWIRTCNSPAVQELKGIVSSRKRLPKIKLFLS